MRSLHCILSLSLVKRKVTLQTHHITSLDNIPCILFRFRWCVIDIYERYFYGIMNFIFFFTVSSFRALILFYNNRMINKCSISNMNLLQLYYKYELVNVIKLGYGVIFTIHTIHVIECVGISLGQSNNTKHWTCIVSFSVPNTFFFINSLAIFHDHMFFVSAIFHSLAKVAAVERIVVAVHCTQVSMKNV